MDRHDDPDRKARRLRSRLKRRDNEIARLSDENARLQSDIKEMELNIPSLQPWRRELTINEATNEYLGLLQNVTDFVDEWADPIIADTSYRNQSVSLAAQDPNSTTDFGDYLTKWEDLYSAVFRVPNIDQEIIIAFILRYLCEQVFETTLCGIGTSLTNSLGYIEDYMNESTDPKPDVYSIKSWKAQALTALVAHPIFADSRDEKVYHLSNRLGVLLSFMVLNDDHDYFIKTISTRIIEPAFKLHEKFLTSTSDFRVQINSRLRGAQMFDGDIAQLDNLELVDITNSRRKFVLAEIQPEISAEDLQRHLQIICSTYPALIVTEVGPQELEEPAILSVEQILVAWTRGRGRRWKHTRTPWLSLVLNTVKIPPTSPRT